MAAEGQSSGYPRVLTFHKVTQELTYGSTNMSPVRFRLLLAALRDDGHSFLSVEESVRRGGEGRGIGITFDDGYRHLVKTLPPLIEEFQFTPTIFIPTGHVGRNNSWDYSYAFRNDPHLDRDEIQYLASLGVSFGSHGHSHVELTRCDNRRLKAELERSRRILEEIVGNPVTTISYPFGRVDQRVVGAALAAGYEIGFTMCFPTGSDTPLALGRFGVWCVDSVRSVRRKLGQGWLQQLERGKAQVITGLSAGTGLWNRLRGREYTEPG